MKHVLNCLEASTHHIAYYNMKKRHRILSENILPLEQLNEILKPWISRRATCMVQPELSVVSSVVHSLNHNIQGPLATPRGPELPFTLN